MHQSQPLPKCHGNSKPEGSTYIDKYSRVLIKQNGQWRLEHRVIMERLLGRPLLKNEIVHHINKNPQDNRPENLQLCSSIAEHLYYHRKNRLCSIPGCVKPHYAFGYCHAHYQKFRSQNSADRPKCSIEGCNNPRSTFGYCHTHYTRFKKSGNPLFKKTQDFCCIEGCNKKHKGLGYCSMHYQRFKKYGDPLYKKA